MCMRLVTGRFHRQLKYSLPTLGHVSQDLKVLKPSKTKSGMAGKEDSRRVSIIMAKKMSENPMFTSNELQKLFYLRC